MMLLKCSTIALIDFSKSSEKTLRWHSRREMKGGIDEIRKARYYML